MATRSRVEDDGLPVAVAVERFSRKPPPVDSRAILTNQLRLGRAIPVSG
jgi:hypothetical protein